MVPGATSLIHPTSLINSPVVGGLIASSGVLVGREGGLRRAVVVVVLHLRLVGIHSWRLQPERGCLLHLSIR